MDMRIPFVVKDSIVTIYDHWAAQDILAYLRIGVNPKMYFDDQQNLHVKTLFEGKMNAMQFLCSLGASCQLISPIELKKELQQEIRKMMENYE